MCTRQICGFPIRQYSEFNATIRKVPYLGLCLLEKDASSQIFEVQQAVIPPLAHTANFNFDPASLKMWNKYQYIKQKAVDNIKVQSY